MTTTRSIIALLAATLFFGFGTGQTFAAEKNAKERFTQTEQTRKQKLDEYQTVKRLLQAAQQRAKSDKSQEAKKALQQQARQFLMTTLDAMNAQLDAVTGKLDAMTGIDEVSRSAIAAELGVESAWVRQERAAVGAVPVGQLAQRARLIRDHWNTVRSTVKRTLGEIRLARLQSLLAQMQMFGTKLQAQMTVLEAAKVDTSALALLMGRYRDGASTVEQQLRNAESQLQAIRNVPDASQRSRAATSVMDSATATMRESAKVLDTALETLRSLARKKAK